MTRTSPVKDPTRNVWLQLGLPDAEEHYLKAELVLRLYNASKALGVTQRSAAPRRGLERPSQSYRRFFGASSLRSRLKG
jgi:hypothetical protein